MILGVDFDNTIVCYDKLFHQVALEQQLIPDHVPAIKDEIRDYLRQRDQEASWTELQGYIYGARMQDAEAFPGVIDFFEMCQTLPLITYIISHKTRHPFKGPPYDLHEAAINWLQSHGLTEILPQRIFFELTKEAKLKRIAQAQCTHFIDDLPEFLTEPTFPANVQRILFDPAHCKSVSPSILRITSWKGMLQLLP